MLLNDNQTRGRFLVLMSIFRKHDKFYWMQVGNSFVEMWRIKEKGHKVIYEGTHGA